MIKVYRKTATIKAEQFDGSDEMVKRYKLGFFKGMDTGTIYEYTILTVEGRMDLNVGDWIATGVNGEHWAIANDVFKKTYAELPVVPKVVAEWIKKCKKDMVSICWAMNERNLPKKVADYFRIYYTRDQWIELQDNFARAWLDGYIVEGSK